MMRLSVAPFVFMLALSLVGCANQPATKTFHVDLAGSHEVPPVNSPASGTADLSFEPTSKQLTWKISYAALTSEPTGAHIHGPARPGDNAGVLINLAPNGMRNPLEGSATLTDEQVDYLMLGRCYINIHTSQNKGGEIRGHIAPYGASMM
jgi:hypothetical protein